MSAAPLSGFEPVIDDRCRVLILGSFPSVASLAAGGYYAHPRNRFWPILAEALGEPALPALPFAGRYRIVRGHGLGIWDVVARCRRPGSLDADIRDPHWNAFDDLSRRAPGLRWVLFNGRLAGRHEAAFCAAGYRTRVLPSTSPANAAVSARALFAAWHAALDEVRAGTRTDAHSGAYSGAHA